MPINGFGGTLSIARDSHISQRTVEMPTPNSQRQQGCPPKLSTEAPVKARIDAAHEISKKETADEAAAQQPITQQQGLTEEPSCDTIAAQLRTQAGQLASHLRARQKELDHREAQVNARLAQLDRSTCAARLWLREREAELNLRDKRLGEQQSELQKRLERLAAAEAVRRKRNPSEDPPSPPDAKTEDRAEVLQSKQDQLAEAEARLAEARAETQEFQQQLRKTRRDLEENWRAEQRRWTARQQQAKAKLERQRKAVQHRSNQVDESHAALQQLRAELGRMHRETLEIRLATEELWIQLSGVAPPASLTRSLGRIRTKLADHYRQANAELKSRKEELETVRHQLAEQYEELVERKSNFDKWAMRHQEEVEQQAARLIAREKQLARKEAQLTDDAHHRKAERLQYQQEIGYLRSKISEADKVAVPA